MKLRTFNYCFKQGFINLFKNRLMTLASIGTISICLFVIGIFYTVIVNIEYMLDDIEKNIGITVFFDEGIDDKQVEELQSTLERRSEVYSIDYISPEEAWESLKKDYFKGKEHLLAGYEDSNPLENSGSFQIHISDTEKQAQLVTFIKSLKGIRFVRQAEDVTNIITGFNALIKYVSVVLIIVLIIMSVFLISNTVRLGITLRKTEINIMKYIGATDYLIRFPFIIEGIIIGTIGSVIPVLTIYYSYYYLIQQLNMQFGIIKNFLVFMNITDIVSTLAPLSLVIGVGIGVMGSRITIHKYLRV